MTDASTGDAVLSAAIAMLYPRGVVAAELRGSADATALLPPEAEQCRGSAAKRVADFAAGRLCARRALGELGYARFALLAGEDRRPLWPAGIVGSISHTRDFCGAAVASAARFASLGFDAECVGRIDEELWPSLFTGGEITTLRRFASSERSTAATIAFSAKEAYYKCRAGLLDGWLDFTDVAITFEGVPSGSGALDVHPTKQALDAGRSAEPCAGRFAVGDGIVIVGVAVLARS